MAWTMPGRQFDLRRRHDGFHHLDKLTVLHRPFGADVEYALGKFLGHLQQLDGHGAVLNEESAGVVLLVTLQPGSVWGAGDLMIAMHGQPSEDDSHVPIIFWGRGVKRGSYTGRMNTVDIAPTLARLIGISPLALVDGHARTDALELRN